MELAIQITKNLLTELNEVTLQWPFLLGAFTISLCYIYLSTKKSLKETVWHLLNKKIWFHRSAKTDYKIAIINAIIYSTVLPTSLFTSLEASDLIREALEDTFGNKSVAIALESSLFLSLLFSLLVILIIDFISYIVHFSYHKIPALWEFHKVHHSAKVLTPLSTFRVHPIVNWIGIIINAAILGFVFGLLKYLINSPVSEITLYGLNIFAFFINLFGGLLTHSHIRIQWPFGLSKLLISPLDHQIHHSNNPKHFDKNFGFWFSIWDVIFGTYYKGKKNERLVFGLGRETSDYYRLRTIYFRPITRIISNKNSLNYRKTKKPLD